VNDGNLVADSSALLAALKNEPFSNLDSRELVGATISASIFVRSSRSWTMA
jgi:hypothetical protein